MRSWTAEFLSVLECVSTEINTLDFLRCSFGSFAVFSPFFFLFVKRDNRFVNLVITCRNSRLLKPFSNTRSVNSFELIHTFHAFRRETVAITVHPMRSDPHSSFRYPCLQPVFLFSRLVCLNCLTRAYLRSSG